MELIDKLKEYITMPRFSISSLTIATINMRNLDNSFFHACTLPTLSFSVYHFNSFNFYNAINLNQGCCTIEYIIIKIVTKNNWFLINHS